MKSHVESTKSELILGVMKALIADHVNKKLSLEERDQIPSIDEQDDVIVRIVCAGVCGTDISTLHGKYPGKHGIINGHEVNTLTQDFTMLLS